MVSRVVIKLDIQHLSGQYSNFDTTALISIKLVILAFSSDFPFRLKL
jgi:hypothetical protein